MEKEKVLDDSIDSIGKDKYYTDNSPINDWGKGIRYYTCDGRQVDSLEKVMLYNQAYYDAMKKRLLAENEHKISR